MCARSLFRSIPCRLLGAVVLLAVAGCSTVPDKQVEKVDGRSLEFVVRGSGSPVVVFDSALGVGIESWNKVLPEVSTFTTAFAYNRRGYGRSGGLGGTRAGRASIEDLRRLLRARGLAPPYVLVGHSFGGLYSNLYARMYPQDVAGVVLIESAHPDQDQWWWKERPLYKSVVNVISAINILDPAAQESFAIGALSADVRNAGPFPPVPLLVVTADSGWFLDSSAWREQWLQYQRDLAALSPHSRQVTATGSGHFVPHSQPGVVIESVRDVVEQVRRNAE